MYALGNKMEVQLLLEEITLCVDLARTTRAVLIMRHLSDEFLRFQNIFF